MADELLEPDLLANLITGYLEAALATARGTWKKRQEELVWHRNEAIKHLTTALEGINQAEAVEQRLRDELVGRFGSASIDDRWTLEHPSPAPFAIARARKQLVSASTLLQPDSQPDSKHGHIAGQSLPSPRTSRTQTLSPAYDGLVDDTAQQMTQIPTLLQRDDHPTIGTTVPTPIPAERRSAPESFTNTGGQWSATTTCFAPEFPAGPSMHDRGAMSAPPHSNGRTPASFENTITTQVTHTSQCSVGPTTQHQDTDAAATPAEHRQSTVIPRGIAHSQKRKFQKQKSSPSKKRKPVNEPAMLQQDLPNGLFPVLADNERVDREVPFAFVDGVHYAFRHPTRHHDTAYYVLLCTNPDLYADPGPHEFKDNPLAGELALRHFTDKNALCHKALEGPVTEEELVRRFSYQVVSANEDDIVTSNFHIKDQLVPQMLQPKKNHHIVPATRGVYDGDEDYVP